VPTAFRFAGMRFDSDTGLYHTPFRQYDPNQARWMGVDAIPGSNRFEYVLSDPVNLSDPLGLCPGLLDTGADCIGLEYIEGGFELIGGQLQRCVVDGLGMPCSEFVAYGYLDRLRRDAESEIIGWRGRRRCGAWDDCSPWVISPIYGNAGKLSQLDKLLNRIGKALENPDCAAMLGGPKRAQKILGKVNAIVDVSKKKYTPDDKEAGAVANIRKGKSLSAVRTSYNHLGQWSGASIKILIGKGKLDVQATKVIHELWHVALGNTPMGAFILHGPNNQNIGVSTDTITTNCRTKRPKGVPR